MKGRGAKSARRASVQRRPAPRRAGESWRAWLNRAIEAHRGGKLDAADRLYRKVLATQTGQPDALHFLGVLEHQRGNSDKAVELISSAVAITPGHADAHNNLGNVHKECGRLAEAEACYRRALDCRPGHLDALGNLGVVLDAQGRVPQAFAAYGRFLEAAPRSARAHYLMGLFLRSQAQSTEHVEQAAQLFRRSYELDRHWLSALHELAVTLYMLKRPAEAREVYRDWLARDPENPVPRHMLAAMGGAEVPQRAGDDYVRDTFDRFADSFDEQLLQHLEYRAPRVLVEALAEVLPPPATSLDVLDAGCGTGLCGPGLRPWARRLAGVDLSAGMVAKARARGDYDELVVAELTKFLGSRSDAFDAVVSADTLVYFGDLAAVARATHAALRPGGWFVFSLEAVDGEGYRLSASGRYRHSDAYIKSVLGEAGFVDLDITPAALRKEVGEPVPGWVVRARRAETPKPPSHLVSSADADAGCGAESGQPPLGGSAIA